MFASRLAALWADDSGTVIATEYLMLGSVVALGGATGLAAVRDSVNAECREYGQSVRDVRQQYQVTAPAPAARPAATEHHAAVGTPVAVSAAVPAGTGYVFSVP